MRTLATLPILLLAGCTRTATAAAAFMMKPTITKAPSTLLFEPYGAMASVATSANIEVDIPLAPILVEINHFCTELRDVPSGTRAVKQHLSVLRSLGQELKTNCHLTETRLWRTLSAYAPVNKIAAHPLLQVPTNLLTNSLTTEAPIVIPRDKLPDDPPPFPMTHSYLGWVEKDMDKSRRRRSLNETTPAPATDTSSPSDSSPEDLGSLRPQRLFGVAGLGKALMLPALLSMSQGHPAPATPAPTPSPHSSAAYANPYYPYPYQPYPMPQWPQMPVPTPAPAATDLDYDQAPMPDTPAAPPPPAQAPAPPAPANPLAALLSFHPAFLLANALAKQQQPRRRRRRSPNMPGYNNVPGYADLTMVRRRHGLTPPASPSMMRSISQVTLDSAASKPTSCFGAACRRLRPNAAVTDGARTAVYQVRKAAANSAAATRRAAAATKQRLNQAAAKARAASRRLTHRHRWVRAAADNPDDADRPRRGLAAVGGMIATGLVGLVTGLLSPNHGPSAADLRHVVESTAERFNLEDRQLRNLGLDLNRSFSELSKAETMLSYTMSYLGLSSHTSIYLNHVEVLLDGLHDLLHRRLHPGLVSPTVLQSKLKDVATDMARLNAVPISQNVLDLYSTDVSHSFDLQTLTVTVKVGVPGEIKGSREQLKRLLPFPIKITKENKEAYVIPEVSGLLLGVRQSLSGPPRYRSVPTLDLMACPTIAGTKVCHATSEEFKSSAGTCLSALWVASQRPSRSPVLDACQLRSAAGADAAVRVTRSRYRVFLRQQQNVNAVCRDEAIDLGTHQGLLEVSIPANCSVTTTEFLLRPERRLKDRVARTEVHELRIDIRDDPAETFEAWNSLSNHSGIKPVAVTLEDAKKWMVREESLLKTDSDPVLAGLLVAGLVVTGLVMACGVHYCGWKPATCMGTVAGAVVACLFGGLKKMPLTRSFSNTADLNGVPEPSLPAANRPTEGQ